MPQHYNAIPQQALDLAQTLFTRQPGHFGKFDPGSAIGAHRQDPQQAMMDVGMMGLTSPLKLPGLAQPSSLEQLQIAKNLFKGKNPQARQTAIEIIQYLADQHIPRHIIDKLKGNPQKLAAFLSKQEGIFNLLPNMGK